MRNETAFSEGAFRPLTPALSPGEREIVWRGCKGKGKRRALLRGAGGARPGRLGAECPRYAGAFSLAETLFAMAIVSFALLSIIGLMPSALSDVNEAEQRSAEARILQSLTAEYELKPWREVKNSAGRGEVYFDVSGIRLQGLNREAQYAARIDPMPPRGGTSPDGIGELSLPGEDQAGAYLYRLRVLITDQPHNSMAFASSHLHHEHALVLVNREPDLPETAPP